MQSIIEFNPIIFIGVFNIIIYFIGFLSTAAALIWDFTEETENLKSNKISKFNNYLNIYKTLLLIMSFIMIIISFKLIKGFIKKSISLIVQWLSLTFIILVCQSLYLLDQIVSFLVYSKIYYSAAQVSGLIVIFGLQILSFKTVLDYFLDLYKMCLLQNEEIYFVKHPTLKPENYLKNLTQNDSSILVPLNEEELRKEYAKSDNVNLNSFEI